MAEDTYKRLIELLDQHGAQYRLIDHPPEGRTEVVSPMRGNDLRDAAKCMILMIKLGKVTGGIRQQTQQAIHNIESVPVDLGLTLAHIVRTTVYLRDMKDFVAMDEVYARFFGTELPARSTIQAPLPFGALVALDAIANRTITIA